MFLLRNICSSIDLSNVSKCIDSNAFKCCTNLTSIVLSNELTCIEDFVFDVCTNLSSIVFPNNLTHIGISAFRFCTSLTSINLPNTLTHIYQYAFYGCTNIKSIILPPSVTHIGVNAFKIGSIKSCGKHIKYGEIKNKINNCPICLDNFADEDDILILNCFDTHYFHKKCNLYIDKSCPLCRSLISYTEIASEIKIIRH